MPYRTQVKGNNVEDETIEFVDLSTPLHDHVLYGMQKYVIDIPEIVTIPEFHEIEFRRQLTIDGILILDGELYF